MAEMAAAHVPQLLLMLRMKILYFCFSFSSVVIASLPVKPRRWQIAVDKCEEFLQVGKRAKCERETS